MYSVQIMMNLHQEIKIFSQTFLTTGNKHRPHPVQRNILQQYSRKSWQYQCVVQKEKILIAKTINLNKG